MILAVDSGNTQAKAGLFVKGELREVRQLTLAELSALQQELQPEKSIICDVSGRWDAANNPSFYFFTHQSETPLRNEYRTPETLGMDRLAAAIGSASLYPNATSLIIDAGTCITIDLVVEGKRYIGGSISPGIQMRYKALQEFTGKLPLGSLQTTDIPLTGQTTGEAIASGVQNGVLEEIRGTINRYSEEFKDQKILLCGGDAGFLYAKLQNTIFAENLILNQDLVLHGLHAVAKTYL